MSQNNSKHLSHTIIPLQFVCEENTFLVRVLYREKVFFVADDICNILQLDTGSVSELDANYPHCVLVPGNTDLVLIDDYGLMLLSTISVRPLKMEFLSWALYEILPNLNRIRVMTHETATAMVGLLEKIDALEGERIKLYAEIMSMRNNTDGGSSE